LPALPSEPSGDLSVASKAATTAFLPEDTFSGKSLITLPVPYFCQRDSTTWQGNRMGFFVHPAPKG
jgi:hypothetical protein